MKLCVDCKHYKPYVAFPAGACTRKAVSKTSPVNGIVTTTGRIEAEDERQEHLTFTSKLFSFVKQADLNYCGPDGLYWEQK